MILTVSKDDLFLKTVKAFVQNKLDLNELQIDYLFNNHLVSMDPTSKLILNDKIIIYSNPFKIDIIYEDKDLLIINKPAGLTVHPGASKESYTLVDWILKHDPSIALVGESNRPGIVHRLDKGTSGILLIAKTKVCYEHLYLAFKERRITKIYEALTIKKNIPKFGKIDIPLTKIPLKTVTRKEGQDATTFYSIIKEYPNFLHLRLQLITGRTHQARVHLQHLKIRILNDPLYGNPNQDRLKIANIKHYPYPLLHAKKIELLHPITSEKLIFETDLPEIFNQIILNDKH